jgi:hypothetical protein
VKPLTEQVQQLEGAERQLADLFAAAEPARSDPFRKRRILVRLTKQTLPTRSGWRRALVATLLLGVTAAAATMGRGPIKAAWNGLWPRQPAAEASNLQSTQRAIDVAKPQSGETVEHPMAPAASPLTQPATVQQTPTSASTPKLHSIAEPKHPASSEDPSQVVSAIRALRNEHNPARAKTLLNGYLQSHPQGALTEDVLALSIEAATATNDPKSAEFARTYLVKYPNGRYRALAVKALGH